MAAESGAICIVHHGGSAVDVNVGIVFFCYGNIAGAIAFGIWDIAIIVGI